MSRKGGAEGQAGPVRQDQLDRVWEKALDVSVNAMGESELTDSFGDLKPVFGNNLQKLLRNALDRISTNARIAYKDSCVLYDVDEGLRNLENAPPVLSKDALLSTEDPLLATVAELRAVEAESIQTAIKALEDEARALENKKKKLQQQIKEELTAANDIHSMLASAAVQGK